MLEQILARLDEGRPWTVASLADELDTTTEPSTESPGAMSSIRTRIR